MALVRYKNSIGFVVQTASPDPYLLTVFIPDTDPPANHTFASITHALQAGGFFAQYDSKLPQLQQDPNSVFRTTKEWASPSVAFALMRRPTESPYVVNHDGSWSQNSGLDWDLPHLSSLKLTAKSGGEIRQHQQSPDHLQLGQFNFRLGNFSIDCSPAINLVSGRFGFDFIADLNFFTTLRISQPFQAGMSIVRRGREKFVRSASMAASIFNTNTMAGLAQPLRAELDIYPYSKDLSGADLSKVYLARTGFKVLENPTPGAGKVLLNIRDTLGRQLETNLGWQEKQYFRFLPAPISAYHEPNAPDQFRIQVEHTALIPQGVFPVESALSSGENARRIKFGPSNTEVLEIIEQGGRPNISLNFVATPGDPNGRSTELATGGFLRQSMAKLANDAGASDTTVEELLKGPALTSHFDGVWPKFMAMDENGEASEFGGESRSGGGLYSVQPDKIVRFAVDGQSPDATPDALGYQREIADLGRDPMPITFLDGIAEAPMGPDTKSSDLEKALAGHRFKLREDKIKNARASAGRSAEDVRTGPTRSAGDKPDVTPQGFEVVVKEDSRCFVLAKTERGDASLSLMVDVKSRALELLFQQDGYVMVLPTNKVVDPDSRSEQDNGIDFKAEVQMGSWAFDLAFSEKAPNSRSGAKPDLRSVVVLKYRKGKLKDLLTDESTWDNYRSGLMTGPWVDGAKEAARQWLEGIEKNKDDRAYSVIHTVVHDEAWTGVLMINPTVDLDNLPEALQSLVAGIDLERFRGHHIGFTQNKIETDRNGGPFIQKSALFGLIDYKDQKGFGHPKVPNGAPAPKDKFDFRVNTLQVLFANTEVVDFDCLLRIYVPSWFKDKVKEAKGGPKPSHMPPDEVGDRRNVFAIRGRYESFLDANKKKVTRYSFVSDGEIKLIQEDETFIFEKVVIDRVELRTTKSFSPSAGKREIRSELLVDAVIEFKDDLGGIGLDDIMSFKSLELSEISIPFGITIKKNAENAWEADDWKLDLPRLTFDGLSLGTDPKRRRDSGLLSKFPVKFKTFRFFETPKGIGEFKFLELFSNAGGSFEYGLEWDVDFGSLAKMLGLDSSLKGTLIVGWMPRESGDGFGRVSVGLRFDDMGGDRLDIGIGSVLRLKAGNFDVFSPRGDDKGTVIVASDMSMVVLGEERPKDPDKLGLILAPNGEDPLNGPLGWMTMLAIEELGFIEKFRLGLGQNMKYIGQGADTPSEIIKKITDLTHFSMDPDLAPACKLEKSKEFRADFEKLLEYNQGNEWFIALGGEVAKIGSGHAVYNPPSLFGGEIGIEGLFTISVMYRQETPQVGVYTGTLTISEDLRSIDVGAVRIQLPRIAAKIDTDGGFSVNIGLNTAKPDDLSNAAGAEVTIFKGDAGLLYANIHGSAFDDIPRIRNAQSPDNGAIVYSPITRIMLAGRFGLGREFKKSILSAGASITIYGILSGTWGSSNLAKLSQATQVALKNDGLPSHYNKYWGEVGVIAEIYGVVDFGVTRQRLDARLLVGIGIVFETWQDTLAYIRGELRISLEWVIARFKVFGKTIEIRITLSFSTEYRQDYVLAKGESAKYQKWFGSGQRSAELAERPYRDDGPVLLAFDWNRKPAKPQPGEKKPMPLLVTLDMTVDDARKPKLVPMTFIPYKATADGDNTIDPGPFKDLVQLVFEWSLLAYEPQLPGDAEPIPFHDLLEIEAEIATRDWAGNRGSWEADKAWKVLAEQFDFTLHSEWDGNLAGGTIFTLPGGFTGQARFDGNTAPQTIKLGGTEVPGEYLQLLDKFFDKLRVKVNQERNEDVSRVYTPSGAERSLDRFLFEEFLESICRAVWSRITGAILRAEPEWETAPRLDQLRAFLAKESVAISGMLNRQSFSGTRLPKTNTAGGTQTVALWDKAKRTIDVAAWSGKGIKEMTLTATHPGFTQSVEFKVDEAGGNATSPIDDLPGIDPKFGSVEIKQLQPFHLTRHEPHPLPERVPLVVGGQNTETFWSVPEILAAKADQLHRDTLGADTLKVVLEPIVEDEIDKDDFRDPVDYDPVMLVAVPVLPIGESKDAFVIQQMNETDRRLLDEFDKAGIPDADIEIAIYAQKQGQNGRVENMSDPGIDLSKSFIGRVNLATDPNPPVIELQRASRSDDLPIRARPVSAEYSNFLKLLRLAAETNSGGYLLHLDGWTEKDPARVWVAFRLRAEKYEGILPIYINRFVTQEVVGPDSLGHVLREEGQLVVPNGEPGVFTAWVERQNPNTMYRDPLGPSDGPTVLTRVQALNIIERDRGLAPGTLVDLDAKGQLPASVLDAAGGQEVDMAKRFNLMQMDIIPQGGFEALLGQCDLPTGPEKDETVDRDNPDKLIYKWSIPAHEFVKKTEDEPRNDLFKSPGDPFIYDAIGRRMKVRATFRDVLGYAPTLSQPVEKQLEGKYFDPLISITGLTGLQVTHSVDGADGSLKIAFAFNPRAVVTVKNTSGPVRLPRDGDGNVIEGEAQRVLSVRASYARLMQQLRDANTDYHLMSALRFDGRSGPSDEKTALTKEERQKLHTFLKECRDALDQLAQDTGISGLTFEMPPLNQKGTPPKNGVTRYGVRFCAERPNDMIWADISDLERTKVRRIAADIPLPPRTTTSTADPTPSEKLVAAVKSGFAGKIRLAYTRDAQDDEALYVVNDALLDLKYAGSRKVPAFAALKPLSTKPYAVAETKIWDWAEKKAPPPDGAPEDDWVKREISAFDQDAALTAYLRDVDIALSPEQANAVWSSAGTGAQAFDDLLAVKARIAEAAPTRATTILDVAADRTSVDAATEKLQTNLENSFKKRLGRLSDVDTALVMPLTYPKVGPDGRFLLYGRVANDKVENGQTVKADDHHFLPAALRRNGTKNTLILQFDAREPAGLESFETDAKFAIEHIRWDRDGSDTPDGEFDILSTGVIWLKLFDAKEIGLALKDNGTPTSVTVPILFKKLVTKPDISVAPPGLAEIDPSWDMAMAIKEARKWTFNFDVERARAATQDDWYVDAHYNTRPEEVNASRSGTRDRPIGDVLFEFTQYRATLNTPENQDLWLQALAYWGHFVALGLVDTNRGEARSSGDLEKVTQNFVIEEHDPQNGTLEITLRKEGTWRSTGFKYSIDPITGERLTIDQDGSRAQGEGALPRSLVIDKPDSSFDTGEYYAGRRIGTHRLDIFNFENAWPAVMIKRNASLKGFEGKKINTAFIYETDEVRTGEPITPLLVIDEAINLPPGSGGTVRDKIKNSLKLLLDEVFKDPNDPTRPIDPEKWPLVDISWGYNSGQLDKYIDVPDDEKDHGMSVFASDPIGMFTARKLKPDYSNGIPVIMTSLSNWQARNLNKKAPTSGRYVFQLRIYSRLERVEKPLLILTDLRYTF